MNWLCSFYKKRIIICDGCNEETTRWYTKSNKSYCRRCIIEKVEVSNEMFR